LAIRVAGTTVLFAEGSRFLAELYTANQLEAVREQGLRKVDSHRKIFERRNAERA